MDTNTVVLLGMMGRLLTQFLELANRIENEADLLEISNRIKQQPKRTKAIQDALSFGNLFLLAFFCKELVESLTDETPKRTEPMI